MYCYSAHKKRAPVSRGPFVPNRWCYFVILVATCCSRLDAGCCTTVAVFFPFMLGRSRKRLEDNRDPGLVVSYPP